MARPGLEPETPRFFRELWWIDIARESTCKPAYSQLGLTRRDAVGCDWFGARLGLCGGVGVPVSRGDEGPVVQPSDSPYLASPPRRGRTISGQNADLDAGLVRRSSPGPAPRRTPTSGKRRGLPRARKWAARRSAAPGGARCRSGQDDRGAVQRRCVAEREPSVASPRALMRIVRRAICGGRRRSRRPRARRSPRRR
jgi:hypothetical protein